MNLRNFPLSLTLVLILGFLPQLNAQKALEIQDLVDWNQMSDEQISADGNYLLYTLSPDVGDPVAVVKNLRTGDERRFERLHDAKIDYNGKYLIGILKPSWDEAKSIKLTEKKQAAKKLPKMDSLLVWALGSEQPDITPTVYDYAIGDRWSGYYAYTTDSALPDSIQRGLDKSSHRLLIRNFSQPDSFYLEGVTSYQWARDAGIMLAHQAANDGNWTDGVLRLDTKSLEWKTISRGPAKYRGMQLSHDGQQVAFLSGEKEDKAPQPPFHLHYFDASKMDTARIISRGASTWLQEEQRISDDQTPFFSEDKAYLFFGTAPRRAERDTTLLDEEIADVEVWTSEDERMYPQQNLRKRAEESRTYLAVYRIGSNDFVQLADDRKPEYRLPEEASSPYVLLYNEVPYLKKTTWEGGPADKDLTVVNLEAGTAVTFARGEPGTPRWSTGGKYLVWYNQVDTSYRLYDPARQEVRTLTTNAFGTFYDDRNDRPMPPRPAGAAGWTAGDRALIIYDRYDLWRLDPTGNEQPLRLTRGREANTRYRYVDLDPENDFLPEGRMLLSTFDENNYHGGYAWYDVKTRKVTPLASSPHRYRNFMKARSAEAYVYSREDFREFPDLRFTTDLARSGNTVTAANPQQAEFKWGTSEIYEWVDAQGRTLRGILVKPDNFDPQKQYPLLVNFYERSSEGVYGHRAPYPHRSTINYSYYVSRGYVIFNPDVIYRVGYPGESAYDCVMTGVTSLLQQGFIDRERIGLQGHSWGGYQGAHIATKTDMFAAIESGAPVVNMFSAYGGIRWGSGISRQFQYERTQSRIGGTPWEYPIRYLENSPLFFTDKINTPILIMHNDKDGAVPWYQGIEWFSALRRLGKPAWMLNYRGEPHWPLKPANRQDFQRRMSQFFDHYLMGAPVPRWMEEGVNPVQRGIEQGYETKE
ncbi:prolyl oligopeptidase family serine peptidase [Lewinella sp. W8]|uniref:S9 family peptidase n=1 Tax=Lewinella sp. W8 TaxID=2528208 RepID=UPI0010675FB1|nr:prolyl oligopeptidase family serine peptidase [Lewinella sp. W8]MTB52270.1 prolyl oligopeptidase family serine peptidase [Lewinella sp. W8]